MLQTMVDGLCSKGMEISLSREIINNDEMAL